MRVNDAAGSIQCMNQRGTNDRSMGDGDHARRLAQRIKPTANPRKNLCKRLATMRCCSGIAAPRCELVRRFLGKLREPPAAPLTVVHLSEFGSNPRRQAERVRRFAGAGRRTAERDCIVGRGQTLAPSLSVRNPARIQAVVSGKSALTHRGRRCVADQQNTCIHISFQLKTMPGACMTPCIFPTMKA